MNNKIIAGLCVAGVIANVVLAGPSLAHAQAIRPMAAQQITAPIKFGKLTRYTHPTQWFSMQIPDNWQQQDLSTDERAIISISDPTGNAGLLAAVYGGEAEMSKAEMGAKLAEYIEGSFGNILDFKADDPVALQSFNGAGLVFSYRQRLKDSKTVTMYGDAFYQQYDNTVTGIVVLLLPKEQYESAKTKMYDLLDGIQIQPENYDGASTDPATDAPVVVGDLVDYSDEVAGYFLRVPGAWLQSTGSSNGVDYVNWTDDSGLATLSVVKTQFKALANSAALKKSAQEFMDGYTKGNDNVVDVEIGSSTSLGKNAVLTTFTYTDESESGSMPMTAHVLVRQSGKTAVFVMLTMPTHVGEANTDAVDEMMRSVEIWK